MLFLELFRYFSISPYWGMYVIGFLGSVFLYVIRAKRYNMSYGQAVLFALLGMLTAFLFARVTYICLNLKEILLTGKLVTGMSFFGVVFAGPLFSLGLCRPFHAKASHLAAFCAPTILFFLACVRIGCFFSGCCGGVLVLNGVEFFVPAQIIEAVGDITLAVILLYYETGEKREIAYPWFLVGYGLLRFLLEFVRLNTRVVGIFTRQHLLACVCIAVGLVWLLCYKRSVKYEKQA